MDQLLKYSIACSGFFILGCSQIPIDQSQIQREPATTSTTLAAPFIKDPSIYTQVVAISDVHGMYDETLKLLRDGKIIDASNHWTAGKTLFIVVGDSIDKGPKSVEVLHLWMGLQSEAPTKGGRLIHVLGNHEAEFLAGPSDNTKAEALIAELTAQHISPVDFASDRNPYGHFMRSEPVALRVGNWVFCHSGYYQAKSWAAFESDAASAIKAQSYGADFLTGDDSILEKKDWEKEKDTRKKVKHALKDDGMYGVVFGHQPEAYGIVGRSGMFEKGRMIKIDNGMAPEAGSHSGSLLFFTKPVQMNSTDTPEVTVMLASGQRKAMKPEKN